MIGLAEIREFEAAATRAAADFQPDAVPTPDVIPMWEAALTAARRMQTIATLLARRVEETRTWEHTGHRSAVEFLADRAGTSVAAARNELDVSRRVEELPAIADALREGVLSGPKAALVAEGAAANPDATERLLEQAQRGSLQELRDEVLRVRAAADPSPDATERRIHMSRRVRTWRDSEGGWNLAARGPVAAGARIEAALRPLIDDEFAKARAKERHEPREAYAFDALAALADRPNAGDGSTRPTIRNTTLVRVDLAALRRGTVEAGETCDIPGIGPVPASTARELLGESILKLVVTNGTDVLNVTHLGRGPSVAQKVALLWSSPKCIVEGCAREAREVDHCEPYAKIGQTRLDNLHPYCGHHHDLKTYEGWALLEGIGKRPMIPPDDPRHPKNNPKRDTG